MRTSGKVDLRCTAIEPIHHGAGSSGNTQLLRVQSIVTDAGEPARVPFLSGNSLKHRLRYHAVQYALDVLDVEDGSMSKPEIDLLFSGGRLSKSGSVTDLSQARKLEELFPALSMCGYSAGNAMTESKLRVSHMHLVCAENAWRIPDDLRDHPMASVRAGAFRSDEFGTRHDKGQSLDAARLLSDGEAADRASAKSKKMSTGDQDRGDSLQMIYDFEVISAGAQFWSTVWFRDMTDLELAALASAFHYASIAQHGERTVMHVGAKSSIGYGAISVELRGAVRATAAEYHPTTALVGGDHVARSARYTEHLRTRRDEILGAIKATA